MPEENIQATASTTPAEEQAKDAELDADGANEGKEVDGLDGEEV